MTREGGDMSALDDSFGIGHNNITLLVQSRQAKQKMEFRINRVSTV